jgi:hypothetical protein
MEHYRHPTPSLVRLCFQSPADGHLHSGQRNDASSTSMLNSLASPDPVRTHSIEMIGLDLSRLFSWSAISGKAGYASDRDIGGQPSAEL